MLLKYLYDFAYSNNILNDLAFSPKNIRWIIPLDNKGNLLGEGVIETTGERNKGKEYLAPKTSLDKGVGGIAEFLADGITALFGLDSDPEKELTEKQRRDRESNNEKKYIHFWLQIESAFEATKHPFLDALINFHHLIGKKPVFLRFGKEHNSENAQEKNKWWVKTSLFSEARLGADQFTFQVDNELVILNEDTIRPYWRKIYARELAERDSNSDLGFCLITGKNNVPIAQTHLPKIKDIPGTQSFGASIVSFDKPAFASYGFEQSLNAPISTSAVDAYCNGLNALLSHVDHSFSIGQTVLCFWAKESPTVSGFIKRMLHNPDPRSVIDLLTNPWAGIDRNAAQLDKFYTITLSGNGGRVVVRHWLQITVEKAQENLYAWFNDLNIVSLFTPEDENKKRKSSSKIIKEEKDKLPPLALFRLAASTVREAKDLHSDITSQLYQAALENTAPSILIIKPILYRFEADLQKYGVKVLNNLSRFALLKLIINRNRKEGDPMIEPQLCENNDPAYNCGRLLAIFDDLQMAAHEYKLEGAGVVERYYGSASSAPNTAFGILWRLHQHHLRKLTQRGDKGRAAANAIERRIADIAAKFTPLKPGTPPEFPRTFNLVEQGRFALGFYQQKAATELAKKEAKTKKEHADTNGIKEENNE